VNDLADNPADRLAIGATVFTCRSEFQTQSLAIKLIALLATRGSGMVVIYSGWFSSSEWRLRPLECAHGWSPRGVVQTDRAVARQASKRFSIGDSPWHECCNRLAQLRQKSPKAGIIRGGLYHMFRHKIAHIAYPYLVFDTAKELKQLRLPHRRIVWSVGRLQGQETH
jgi:hypothetical protein